MGDGFELLLQGGIKIMADVVLSAIGLRSHTRLAAKAGVAVDRYQQSLIKDIYTLGTCFG